MIQKRQSKINKRLSRVDTSEEKNRGPKIREKKGGKKTQKELSAEK